MDILTEKDIIDENPTYRKDLLPVWIKIFSWLFALSGLMTIPVVIIGLLGYQVDLAIYGFRATNIISSVGLGIVAIFFLKGLVSLGLLRKTDWGVDLALIDSFVGVIICIGSMLFYPQILGFRLEVLLLVPYGIKMIRIRNAWKTAL